MRERLIWIDEQAFLFLPRWLVDTRHEATPAGKRALARMDHRLAMTLRQGR
jgi:hypothetical protein